MQQDVTVVYRAIIDDVITQAKPEFVQEGVDEAVLDELRVLWENKLVASRVLDPPAADPHPTGAGVGQRYVTGGAAAVAAGTFQPQVARYAHPPHPYPAAQSQQVQQPAGLYGPPSYAAAPAPYYDSKLGKPEPYWQRPGPVGMPQAQQAQRPQPAQAAQPSGTAQYAQPTQPVMGQPYQSAAGVPYQPLHNAPTAASMGMPSLPESRKRTRDFEEQVPAYLQPYAGGIAAGMPSQQPARPAQVQQYRVSQPQPPHLQPAQPQPLVNTGAARIPQQDGPGDDEDEGDEPKADKSPADELGNLSELESDSDDEQPPNIVLAQFEKVTRTKNRWKCNLKHGVMNLDGRDYLFNTATGEMQF